MGRTPKQQALVLCDFIYPMQVPGGHKYGLLGTFNQINLPPDTTFPTHFATPYGTGAAVYVNVTELYGDFEVVLRFRHLETDEVVMESPTATGTSKSPLVALELAMAVPPLRLVGPGMYAMELHVNNEMIGSCRVNVTVSDTAGGEADA